MALQHGTCSGLSQFDYFQQTLNLYNHFPTPSIITDNVGGSVDATALRNTFGGKTKVTLLCTSGYITGLYTCWDQVDGMPTEQVTCPVDVQNEDTCTTTPIKIQTF